MTDPKPVVSEKPTAAQEESGLRRENAQLHAQVRGLTAQVEGFLGIRSEAVAGVDMARAKRDAMAARCAICGRLSEHADWCNRPIHIGNAGYAAVPIKPGIVHGPHCRGAWVPSRLLPSLRNRSRPTRGQCSHVIVPSETICLACLDHLILEKDAAEERARASETAREADVKHLAIALRENAALRERLEKARHLIKLGEPGEAYDVLGAALAPHDEKE
jgi:hypothetical protein